MTEEQFDLWISLMRVVIQNSIAQNEKQRAPNSTAMYNTAKYCEATEKRIIASVKEVLVK